MKRTKQIAIAMVVLVCLAILPAAVFAAGSEEDSAAAAGFELNDPGQFPVVLGDEPYEVDVFTIYLTAETDGERNQAAFTQYIEDLTNVRVNWIEVANSEVFEDRQNLLISSGDLPDVIMSNWGMSMQEAFTYGINGTLHSLTDLVENNMPNLAAEFEKYPEYASQLYMPDGNIYAFPAYSACYHCENNRKAYIYMPWLEKLGLEVPTTTDEFREVLIAFRDQDPNGNGANDEIPFMSATTGWQSLPIEFIMNSFIYTTRGSGRYLMRDGGRLRFVANTQQWRDGLTYMAELVDDGLLAPETFVQQNDQLKALVENPDYPLVGVSTAGHYGVFTVLGGETGRYAEYRSFPPLEGPTGIRQSFYEPRRVAPHTKITTAEERPDIIAQWIDWFYAGLENQLLAQRYWMEGTDYRFTTAEERETMVTRAGTPALVVPNTSSQRYGIDKFNDGWGRTVPQWTVDPWEALTDVDDPANLEARLMTATRDHYRPYISDHWMPPGIVFDPGVTDELADLTEALVSDTGLVQRWSTQFIVGEKDIHDDAQWQQYLEQLENAGVERYHEIWEDRMREGGFLD